MRTWIVLSKKLKRRKYLTFQLNWVEAEIEKLASKDLSKEELQKAKNHFYCLKKQFQEELEKIQHK